MIKVWWALMWRVLLFSVLVGFAIGVAVGIVASVMGENPASFAILVNLAGMLTFMVVSFFVCKKLLTKGFGRYRLAVVEKD